MCFGGRGGVRPTLTGHHSGVLTRLPLLPLQEFFRLYPELAPPPFYVVGESYAGVYIPMAVQRLLSRPNSINLQAGPPHRQLPGSCPGTTGGSSDCPACARACASCGGGVMVMLAAAGMLHGAGPVQLSAVALNESCAVLPRVPRVKMVRGGLRLCFVPQLVVGRPLPMAPSAPLPPLAPCNKHGSADC
jgi:hypothetical protein